MLVPSPDIKNWQPSLNYLTNNILANNIFKISPSISIGFY